MLRAQVVRVVLGTGLFDWNDTRLTAAALALFVLSSTFQCLLLLFMRGFYSAGITRKPFFITLFSTAFLLAVTYGLVKFFYLSDLFRYFVGVLLKVDDLPNTAVLMLPLAFSLGTILNAVVLWVAFEREFAGFTRSVARTFLETFGAAVIMGTIAYFALDMFDNIFNTATLLGLFSQGLLASVFSIAAGILVFIGLKSKEIAGVWEVIHGRFWKAKVIATDPEIV
ncbi:MAG: hypothetical protein A3A26_02840 [Candidatus Zambryskibacteria bacterium RIFCSPLOWO2_01_FULL_47_14]|uniref:Uncharacterized protein n=1 Tax=Candidatus Zambryskibacteria bacterium RIFCSPLOWO2_01_FULL_47_14 TaxID=1802763 RepID=A0A1G2U880_9BACT|nr:MAG: hypothetical protein A3A26_02840 [Candidatus Zambryskibacteria bacterium RIFCSPLOWO2_01_FULL_47_14]